jgi:AbrB family looped-hinge helix DNA binding protein
MSSEATVTSKGQITIPADVRKAMGLEPGERVVFSRLEDGTTVMRAKTRTLSDLKGLLKSSRPRGAPSKTKVSIADMNIGRS